MININGYGRFTWDFGNRFLIETDEGNFVWSDPDYGGDNTIKPYYGDTRNFTSEGFCGRDKGYHIISMYCGDDVIILGE